MEKIFYDILSNILEIEVNENTNVAFDNNSEWNSIAHIDIIMSLEEEFNIKFSKDDILKLKDQASLLENIKTRIK